MNFKKLNILLVLFISLLSVNSIFYASESESEDTQEVVDTRFVPAATLEKSVQKAVTDTNFNGSVMVSVNNGDSYDILYQGAAGEGGGYNIDTVYDVGSISKLYTTTAIMLLQQDGKLNYNDKISKFIDGVPEDKQNITIKMLLTHTSGIYADENENHSVSKENEIKRILKNDLKFDPDSNYLYSNAGFTLLAAIIESASGMAYEEYLNQEIFIPLGLESTGFPSSEYLDDKQAVSGTLNGVSYGKVTNFDFGWYSKGYADVLTTPRELTYFFQALISGKLLNSDNLALMDLDEVELGNDIYRGYGTDVKHYGTDQEVVGHSGIWYGGNTVAYYRPADKMLFVLACDQLTVSSDLPANYVFNTLNAMYPAGEMDSFNAVDTVQIEELVDPVSDTLPTFDVNVIESETNLKETQTKTGYIQEMWIDLKNILSHVNSNLINVLIGLCIIGIGMLSYTLYYRISTRKATKEKKKKL